MIIGGIEAGGTKMVCAIGNEKGEIHKRLTIPTESPEVTIPALIRFFETEAIEALGIGCFGPIDLDILSPTYGSITSSPKIAWRNFNIVKTFKDALKIPIGFDTDVNGAALGEAVWGAGKDCESVIYITIGTGVGVGVCINGIPLHGLVHPEAGHILVTRHQQDTYEGFCPYHDNCLEGLAAGPAIEGRWKQKGHELAERDEVWELEAFYIAQAVTNYILTLSPNKIVLWGGVMHQPQLFPAVREKVLQNLGGYIRHEDIMKDIDNYIIPPILGEDPGILGAIRLGYLALEKTL